MDSCLMASHNLSHVNFFKCHREVSIGTAFLVLYACLSHINFAFVTYARHNICQ